MKIIQILSVFSSEITNKLEGNIEKTADFTRYLGGKKGFSKRKSITGPKENQVGDLSKSNPESLKLEN